jgi:hypothetical protein
MVKPTSMVDEAVAEMASDFAKCKCVAMAPQCPTPQHREPVPLGRSRYGPPGIKWCALLRCTKDGGIVLLQCDINTTLI